MTDKQFHKWAADNGLDQASIQIILEWNTVPLESKTVRSDYLYSPDSIRDLHDRDGMRLAPKRVGLLIIGSCPNGDPIAIDTKDDPGSIWFIQHEMMSSQPLRDVAVRVADNLRHAHESILSDPDFPVDAYDARRKGK